MSRFLGGSFRPNHFRYTFRCGFITCILVVWNGTKLLFLVLFQSSFIDFTEIFYYRKFFMRLIVNYWFCFFFFTKHWCTKIERQKKIFKCYLFIYLFIHLFCRIGSNLHAVIVSVISLYCFMFDAETTSNPVVWEKFLPALIALFSCRSCLWSHKCHLIRQLHFVFFQCFWTDSTEMMQYLQEWVFLLQWVTSLQVPNE